MCSRISAKSLHWIGARSGVSTVLPFSALLTYFCVGRAIVDCVRRSLKVVRFAYFCKIGSSDVVLLGISSVESLD